MKFKDKPWPNVSSLPTKVFWWRFDPSILSERQLGLESWITSVLPLFGGENVLREFLEWEVGKEEGGGVTCESEQVEDVAVLYEKELQRYVKRFAKRTNAYPYILYISPILTPSSPHVSQHRLLRISPNDKRKPSLPPRLLHTSPEMENRIKPNLPILLPNRRANTNAQNDKK